MSLESSNTIFDILRASGEVEARSPRTPRLNFRQLEGPSDSPSDLLSGQNMYNHTMNMMRLPNTSQQPERTNSLRAMASIPELEGPNDVPSQTTFDHPMSWQLPTRQQEEGSALTTMARALAGYRQPADSFEICSGTTTTSSGASQGTGLREAWWTSDAIARFINTSPDDSGEPLNPTGEPDAWHHHDTLAGFLDTMQPATSSLLDDSSEIATRPLATFGPACSRCRFLTNPEIAPPCGRCDFSDRMSNEHLQNLLIGTEEDAKTIREALADTKKLGTQNDQLESDNGRLYTENSRLQTANETLNTDIDELQAENDRLRGINVRLQQALFKEQTPAIKKRKQNKPNVERDLSLYLSLGERHEGVFLNYYGLSLDEARILVKRKANYEAYNEAIAAINLGSQLYHLGAGAPPPAIDWAYQDVVKTVKMCLGEEAAAEEMGGEVSYYTGIFSQLDRACSAFWYNWHS